MDRPPHHVISRKRRIHHQHVPHKLVIRIVIGKVIQHHQRVVKRQPSRQREFRHTQGHRLLSGKNVLKYWISACIVASSYCGLGDICDFAFTACGFRT